MNPVQPIHLVGASLGVRTSSQSPRYVTTMFAPTRRDAQLIARRLAAAWNGTLHLSIDELEHAARTGGVQIPEETT